MVRRPEQYEYSGHRAYLGLDESKLVDAEPVLRHFGANKKRAVQVYGEFVNAGIGEKSQPGYYLASEGRMLGSEEFQEEVRHRIGDHVDGREKRRGEPDLEAMLKAAEIATGIARREFCTNSKSRELVMIKEAIIVIGQERGIRTRELAEALGMDGSAISKRREAVRARGEVSEQMKKLLKTMRSSV
jgi:hypothetical protein